MGTIIRRHSFTIDIALIIVAMKHLVVLWLESFHNQINSLMKQPPPVFALPPLFNAHQYLLLFSSFLILLLISMPLFSRIIGITSLVRCYLLQILDRIPLHL